MKAPGPRKNGGAALWAGASAARRTCRAKAGTLKSVHMNSPNHPQGRTAALFRMNVCEEDLLPAQFTRERGAELAVSVIVGIGHQPDRTGPLIVPTRIVENRIKANTLDRDTALNGVVNFGAHVVEPGPAARAFGPGFRDQDRAPVPLVHFRQHVAERAIGVVSHR